MLLRGVTPLVTSGGKARQHLPCFRPGCYCCYELTWSYTDEPSPEVIEGCEKFMCALLCPKKVQISRAKDLRWYMFKQLIKEPIRFHQALVHGSNTFVVHMQASIWRQDIIQNPVEPNPLKLGWKEEDGRWVPLLTMELPFQNVLYSLSNANAIPQTVSRVQGDDLVRRTNSSAQSYVSMDDRYGVSCAYTES